MVGRGRTRLDRIAADCIEGVDGPSKQVHGCQFRSDAQNEGRKRERERAMDPVLMTTCLICTTDILSTLVRAHTHTNFGYLPIPRLATGMESELVNRRPCKLASIKVSHPRELH